MNLSEPEVRVLGCMLEKQVTTPDTYPLTLNGLRLACNQSTNRDPVVDYDEETLRDALHRLERRGYARLASGRGSRAAKYRHLLEEALPLGADERAVLCVLMLRGAQTPGELKQRAERMHPLADLDAVHDTLERLIARELACRLERRPGQKEERYEHLLSVDLDDFSPATPVASTATSGMAAAPTMPAAADLAGSLAGEHGQAAPSAGVLADVAGENEPPTSPPPLAGLEERVARLERAVAELRSAVQA